LNKKKLIYSKCAGLSGFCAGFVPAHFENSNRHILTGTKPAHFFAERVNYCMKKCAGFVPAQKRHILNRLVSFYSTET
jgi:hypothetical protein